MIHIDVRADIRKAQIFLQALGENGTKRATARALNRTATTVRAEAARLIRKKRALRIGEIKKALSIKRATTGSLAATVTAKGRSISIRHFAKYGPRGVTVRIAEGGKRTLLTRYGNKAFVNPVWRPGVFVRTTKKRLPIEAWTRVPGIPTVFVQQAIVDAIKRVVAHVFPARIKHELEYEIAKAKAKAGG